MKRPPRCRFQVSLQAGRGGGGNLSLLNLTKKSSVGFFGRKIWADFLTAALSSTPPTHTHTLLPSFPEASLHVYTETASGKLGSAVDLAHAAYSPPCTTDVSVHLLVT